MDIKDLIGEATEYDKKLALEVKKPKSWCKSISEEVVDLRKSSKIIEFKKTIMNI